MNATTPKCPPFAGRMPPLARALAACALAASLLHGCDQAAFDRLHEGHSTEADVRQHLGTPQRVWTHPDGSRTLEYTRQPEGARNYMLTIGADGRLAALRQVLTPENFARVHAGMPADEVRRLLGQPAREVPYPLKNEIVWTWKYLAPPNEVRGFHAVFDSRMRVLRTESGTNPDGPEHRGGA